MRRIKQGIESDAQKEMQMVVGQGLTHLYIVSAEVALGASVVEIAGVGSVAISESYKVPSEAIATGAISMALTQAQANPQATVEFLDNVSEVVYMFVVQLSDGSFVSIISTLFNAVGK